jgi:enterochelin esterase-like enzyme
MKRSFSIILFFCFTIQLMAQLPVPAAGKIVRLTGLSWDKIESRHVDVWVPKNYQKDSTKRFPVIYMHDGQNLFDERLSYIGKEWRVDETITTLASKGIIDECIVVGIWNSPKRFQEYMPEEPFYQMSEGLQEIIVNDRGGKPLSDNYTNFLVNELIPRIDKDFRTLSSKENRFIAGSSMGGLISLYTIIKYPDYFSAAACVSTHWPVCLKQNNPSIPSAIIAWMDEKIPANPPYRLYFDFGTETLDAWYEPYQDLAMSYLTNKGFPRGNLLVTKYTGEGHNEESWAKRFPEIVTFLLKK